MDRLMESDLFLFELVRDREQRLPGARTLVRSNAELPEFGRNEFRDPAEERFMGSDLQAMQSMVGVPLLPRGTEPTGRQLRRRGRRSLAGTGVAQGPPGDA